MEIFQKKSIETLRSLVITLADFEDLKDQSRSKNVRLNKKVKHWQNKIYLNLKAKLPNCYPMQCLE